jgi:hopene-associated glycosyltransferase HpnB
MSSSGALAFAAVAALGAWIGVLLRRGRPWDMAPVGEGDVAPDPARWPRIVAVVPARNEGESLPRTLPALLGQEYPGDWHVVLVDDRSEDGTAEIARHVARGHGLESRLTVIAGQPLPEGWTGKVWAMQQGLREALARETEFVLFTDADILHAPASVRRLAASALHHGVALESRMAHLSCASGAERLLIPPFVWFFNLLYPMRRANDPRDPLAAAAGGCMLVRRKALDDIGGLVNMRDSVIDDCALAALIKGRGHAIRLALSREDVKSVREYRQLSDVWRMVRRTAFTELRRSWLRLAGCILALLVTFAAPPLTLLGGIVAIAFGGGLVGVTAAGLGLAAWSLSAALYLPAIRFFELPSWRAFTLPLAGLLYGAMTADSARLSLSGRRQPWRETAA